MAATPYHVTHAFMQNRADRAGSFVSTGDALYSGTLRIAHTNPKGGITIDLPDIYFATLPTNRHLAACEGLREVSGREIYKIGPSTWGVRQCQHNNA
jgi:hypothetical protein